MKGVPAMLRHLPGVFVCAFALILEPVFALAEGLTLHVAPNGNDRWSGRVEEPLVDRSDGPLATLAGARDAIRKLKKAGPLPQGGVVVEVSGGVYEMFEPLSLQSQDSGTAEAPIVYRAAKGAEVRLIGGKVVGQWKPVADPAVLDQLDPTARGHVLQADLKAQGVTDIGAMAPGGEWGQSSAGLELFFQETPMTLARWPNKGFVKIPKVLGPTLVDCRGTKGCKEGHFSYEGDRPKRWVGQPDVMLHGYWFWDWADQRLKIQSIDPEKRVIKLDDTPQHAYGFRNGQWYYAYNLLCEIDQPGEWYLDRAKGILYFWPPAPIESAKPMISVAPSLVTTKDASYVVFRGMSLECTRGTAVEISGGTHVRIAACVVRNVGGNGVSMTGKDSAVVGCDIYNIANCGVTASGGDRKTLTPANLAVENCNIHHFGRWNPIYKPGVMLDGVGNRVAHNLIHNAPHMAIGFGGNDHVIECNEIHSVVYESNDAGVMYAGRNATMRGHEIRYNYVHHVYGFEARGCVGVYLDDMFCSANIHGNIFYQVPAAAFIGGGRDNTIENNLFIDCNPAIHIDCRALNWAKDTMGQLKQQVKDMPYKEEPWKSRFPQLLTYLDDEPATPKGNVVARNICVGGRWDDVEGGARPHVKFQDNLVTVNPGFVGTPTKTPVLKDFRLRKDSPAWKIGFTRIPIERIGLYKSEDRASWPVRHTVRPKPGVMTEPERSAK
jgi:hypothetical protein